MSDQMATASNSKANYDHTEVKSSKQNTCSTAQSKQHSVQSHSQQETDKKANSESTGGIQFAGSGYNGNNQSNQSSHISSAPSTGGVGLTLHENNSNNNNNTNNTNSSSNSLHQYQLHHHHTQLAYQKGDFPLYYNNNNNWNNNNNNIIFCKNHANKEVTKICLQAGCSLAREICDECEKQPPHSSHPQAVVDAKRFFVDVELGLKEFRINSPLMNASEMLEQGRLFILSHFQSMNNMLIEKSPQLIKILALIEQTENAKRMPIKTYELEIYIRDVMTLFHQDKSGKLEAYNQIQLLDQDIVKEEISSVLFMLRDLENVVRLLHDDFAKALRFGDYSQYSNAPINSSSLVNNIQMPYHNQLASLYQGTPTGSFNLHNDLKSHPKSSSEIGQKLSSHFNANHSGSSVYSINQQLNNYPHNQESTPYNKIPQSLLHPKDSSQLNLQGIQKNWGQQQFHPSTYHTDMDIEGVQSNINLKNLAVGQALNQIGVSSSLLSTKQLIVNADVLMDPAFLKRPRGRPKGSKCKRKGKYKGKYTDAEKLQILQEVGNTKSVQVVAEKYCIQNSLIRYWARQLKYELDPQTISSRRPYRTFTRESKKVIVQEAIKKRDIVLVAQEYDVNAQVLKRWILKSAQGALQSQEMRQMMNAVPNGNGEDYDNSQSQDDSDLHSDDDEDDDDDGNDNDNDNEEDEDEDNMGDDQDQQVSDGQQFGTNIHHNQENNSLNDPTSSLAYKQNKKGMTSVEDEKNKNVIIGGISDSVNNSNSFNNIYNQHNEGSKSNDLIVKHSDSFQKEQSNLKASNDIVVKDEENNSEIQPNIPQNKLQSEEQDQNKKIEKILIEVEYESDDDDSEDDSDEEDDDDELSSSRNLPTKKIKTNLEKQQTESTENNNINTNNSLKDQTNSIHNNMNNNINNTNNINNNNSTNNKKQSPLKTLGNSMIQNKNTLKMIDKSINEILNLDVLKSVDLKNLDLSIDTSEQSERLQQMQQTLQEELQRMKQQQQEIKIKKQINDQKKQLNITKSKTQSQQASK